jgi:hypothetical protein
LPGVPKPCPLGSATKPSLDKSLTSPRVLMKVENAVKVEPVGEFELKGISVRWWRTM